MSFLSKIFGKGNERYVRSTRSLVEETNKREEQMLGLSDEELKNLTQEFKRRINRDSTPVATGVESLREETLDSILPEAFAAVREAARRSIGKRHFDVQLIGGIALHQGKIAEMRTGEGKTLVATLPLYLNALSGRGAHLVTPNDYLSRIGAGWNGLVYEALGVSVGVIAHEFSGIYDPAYEDAHSHGDPRLNHFRPCTRNEAYAADITYGTNNEFGFDYLRDNLEYDPAQLRQRDYTYAIVDEVDSILIDEARTPLIISAPDTESGDLYGVFARLVPQLAEGRDYNLDEKMKAVTITEEGINNVERILGVGNIYEEKGIRFVRHLESSLRAHTLFLRDRDYVVKDGQVIIVDEFTGRLMPGRRWSEGLHQAVEAKEGVTVQQESRTLATITFQNYFRMYGKLAGMTGTAQTSAEEFHKVYGLDVVSIPTHRPMIRRDAGDLIFRTERGKLQALAREVKERHEKGQPVLIGTVSIEKNERLSKVLTVEGVPHAVLNAKNHEQEALIIAQAGKRGAVTVATNMAGRGVDIILGGSEPDTNVGEEVRGAGGLYVIGTERHEARRIDNQLRGRAGRQGDPGASRFFVSLEDDLMRIFGSDRIKRMMEAFGIPEDQPIENKVVSRAIESAQGKIEGFHFDARKHVLEYDDVLNKQRDAVYRMRREILFSDQRSGARLKEQIFEMIEEELRRVVGFHTSGNAGDWNIEEVYETMRSIAPIADVAHTRLREIEQNGESQDERRERMVEFLARTLQEAYEQHEREAGLQAMRYRERGVMLRTIDTLWMDHLDAMEHMRDSVRLRAYGQRDPLVEYKHEGSRLFRELQAAVRTQIVHTIFKTGGTPHQDHPARIELRRPDAAAGIIPPSLSAGNPVLGQINASEPRSFASSPRPKQKEPSRNDPCPCGSYKKYKKCHGKS
ncbi:MAG: preprotein translocase subunit SecA [Candidatus Sungbacteria bacterium RIFCSPHIGHO2_02_FULL_53_17]|uniref:Protein translocase subunit SecA n=1 Tax=Candidatus Sungbacteria bacterium RIFCSPHIGHO2_02_FULL_53_17 TaxID=1802275 RepID=A0A1G2KTZ1_9BACT|nr:MAG: preprotein translocase subunit SecA [Candidatus Sungbacteria bacterium RIFCSPHIGHO2_02_FULL_53_17]